MTPCSKKALEFALKKAKRLRSVVGGEHLLLGIVRVRDGLAAGVVQMAGHDVVAGEIDRARLARLLTSALQAAREPVGLAGNVVVDVLEAERG